MSLCIVVLADALKANEICQKIHDASIPLVKSMLIKPKVFNQSVSVKDGSGAIHASGQQIIQPKSFEIDQVELLNPKLARKARQKNMAMLLGPFGFLAGLTFTQMTGLTTFADLGVGALGEPLTGGLLGLGSGLIGSYVASSTVGSQTGEDIESMKKLNKEGKWLLLLETPFEVELPWNILKEANPIDIIRLVNQ